MVLVGGPECVILEQGWDEEKRVTKTSGKWAIRQTLAFLEHADLVIGPETGVLNAASHMPMTKIVFLSHSSCENLTRDWTNTFAAFSEHTDCPGRSAGVPACHQMHYNWNHCKKDEATQTAQCQADIQVEEVWGCVEDALQKWIPKDKAA